MQDTTEPLVLEFKRRPLEEGVRPMMGFLALAVMMPLTFFSCKKQRPEKRLERKEEPSSQAPRRSRRVAPTPWRPSSTGRPSATTAIHFASERVTLSVIEHGQRMEVEGIYTFENPSSRPWTGRIAYPIYSSEAQPAPKDLLVDEREAPVKIRCMDPNRCAAVLSFSVQPRGRHTLRLRYSQRLNEPKAVYLVTTARKWARPLEKAEFLVEVPNSLKDILLSYTPDATKQDGAKRVYRFVRRLFRPKKELQVTWKRQNKEAPTPPSR